jgi:hypothetical protein
VKPNKLYEKHIYWLTKEETAYLRDNLEAEGIRLRAAKGVVCTPLDEINRIASVAPEVWSDTCGRQGSWYRQSPKNGLYLIVSSFPLKEYENKKTARITRGDFAPPREASMDEIEAMNKDLEVLKIVPSEWHQANDFEKRLQVRWARRFDKTSPEYDELIKIHTANHANFIKPRLFVKNEGDPIPYSIAPSAHLCSCCLELFNVLGEEHKTKYVAPCPGAVIFARLEPNSFLIVDSTNS